MLTGFWWGDLMERGYLEDLGTDHHHFHILLSLLGHRASTKRRHLILFLASCLTSPQLFPSPSTSLWTDLLHVCLGLHLFRCPCGFQSKTSLSMVSCPFLSVCPIQFHFRLLICIDISISSGSSPEFFI